MSLLKTCAAVLSVILVLQLGCDLWCHNAESRGASSLQTAGTPACHGTTEKSEGSEQKPTRHQESPKGCVHLQAADDNSKLQTKIVQATHPVVCVDLPGVHVLVHLTAIPSGAAQKDPLTVSPPSSLILRI